MKKSDRYVFREPISFRSVLSSLSSSLSSRLLSFFSHDSKEEQNKNISNFYREVRFNESSENVVDGSQDYYNDYVQIALKSSIFGKQKINQILDLGCGQAKLAQLSNEASEIKRYIGIDLVISRKTRDDFRQDNAKLYESDLVGFDYNSLELNNTLAVCVNSLCYVNSEDGLLKLFNALDKNEIKRIAVIEPYPGIYWESYFKGIRIKLRSQNRMKDLIEKFDFKVVNKTKLYRFKVFGWAIWPIAYSLVCERFRA